MQRTELFYLLTGKNAITYSCFRKLFFRELTVTPILDSFMQIRKNEFAQSFYSHRQLKNAIFSLISLIC